MFHLRRTHTHTHIVLQLGAWVPATSCEMTAVDRIFTRLGASDNLLEGQSTFFVELAETAQVLANATHSSLVILDELGRGVCAPKRDRVETELGSRVSMQKASK